MGPGTRMPLGGRKNYHAWLNVNHPARVPGSKRPMQVITQHIGFQKLMKFLI
jgi:hypothetical protein